MKATGAAITRRSFLESFAGLAGTMTLLRPALNRNSFCSFLAASTEKTPVSSKEGEIEFETSDAKLSAGFAWAKAQALAYVRNGDPIGPWYEAALPGRNAFCMRDVSHMSTGAQLLGLSGRTRNMLRQFAAHISASTRWCSWWEITGDGKPASVDYKSDRDFWYDLPANFDVLDACYRQWLWSRDDAYIADPVFLDYYHRTVTDYVASWDHDRNGLLDHLAGDGHMGIATYDEDLQDQVLVGADLIAAQYAAYCDYASIEQASGATAEAAALNTRAKALKTFYNSHWWDPATQSFYGALGEDGKFHANLNASTGGSDIEFPLYFGLTEPGPKTNASLDRLEARLHLDQAARTGVIGGVEGVSYLPDIFYKYGRPHAAYIVLRALMDPQLQRRTYPEVSFTVIGNLGQGLMGIRPTPRLGAVTTLPQLVPETSWATLHHLPIGSNIVAVRHTGNLETALTNEGGAALTWEASFLGSSETLMIDGNKLRAETAAGPGNMLRTHCHIEVQPGETHVARMQPA